MPTFVRIGNAVLNLDRVTFANLEYKSGVTGDSCVYVEFDHSEGDAREIQTSNVVFMGEDAGVARNIFNALDRTQAILENRQGA